MTIKKCLFAFLLFFTSLSLAQALPQSNNGNNTVHLTWEHFMKLWQAAKEDKSPRAYSYAYGPALYEGKASIKDEDYWIHFKADLQVLSFSKTPLLVPFLPRQLNPEKVLINGVKATWSPDQGSYQVLIPKEGTHQISTEFTLKLKSNIWPRHLSLPLLPIAQSQIKLTVPDKDVEAILKPGVLLKSEAIPQQSGSVVQGLLGATSLAQIKWLKKSLDEEAIPLKQSALVHTYASLEETGATLQSQINFRILQGKTNQFKIKIPKSLDILDVKAVDGDHNLSQWYSQDQDGHKVIHLYSAYQQSELFRVQVQLEQTVKKSTYAFLVPEITPLEAERVETYFAVGSQNNVEVREEKALQVERLDVRFASPEIQAFAQNHALYYYKWTPQVPQLNYLVKSHEEIPLSTTRIDQVGARSILTESGTVMTKVRYLVKNNQAQFLKVTLPEHSTLLSIYLKGREVQPSYASSPRKLLIPLIKSASQAFPIELAYTSELNKLSYLGSRQLELPATKTAIGELTWRLYTPDRFQMLRFGGNVKEKKPRLNFLDLLNRLVSSDFSDMAYAGGDSYQFNEIQGLKSRFKYSTKNAPTPYQDISLANKQVQVQIPLSGDFYIFSSYLIKGSTPHIKLYYIHSAINKIFGILVSLATFTLCFGFLAFLLERTSLPEVFKNRQNLVKTFIFILVVGSLNLFLSFGIFNYLFPSITLALLVFALWQNRQLARSFKNNLKSFLRFFMDVVLGIFLLLIFLPLIAGEVQALFVLAILSLAVHLFLKLVLMLWKNYQGRKLASSALIVLLSLVSLLGPQRAEAMSQPFNFPSDPKTHLELDWSLVEGLLKKIEAKEEQRKKALDHSYVFGSSTIKGQLLEKYADLRLSVPLQIISKKPTLVSLFKKDVPLQEARLNGEVLPLLTQRGKIFFEIQDSSQEIKTLELRLLLPIKEKGGVQSFELDANFLSGAQIELQYGQKIQSITIPTALSEKKEKKVLKAVLGKEGRLFCEMASFERKKDETENIQKGVKKSYAQTYTLATLEESVITFYSSIRYEIRNDEVNEFVLSLPKDVTVHEIIGEDLQEWKKLGNKGGLSFYQARVLYPVTRYYDLSVKYEQVFEGKNKSFSVPELKVEKVASNITYIGIESQENLAVQIKELKKAKLIDIQELPNLIKRDASAPLIFALRHIESGFTAKFNTKKHERLELEPLLADRVEYTHVISPEGKVIAQARLYLRNSGKQFTKIRLPQGATLLSAFLDKQSIKPGKGEDGSVMLPLKREARQAFVLDLVYEEKDQSFNKLAGSIQLKFPQLEMPVSLVTSAVYAPEDFEYSKPWGDFIQLSISGYARWFEAQKQGLSEPARETTSVDDLGNFNDETLRAEPEPTQAILPPPSPRGDLAFKNKENVAGALPLRIELPKKGKVLQAQKLYLPTQAKQETSAPLQLRIFYGHQLGVNALAFLQYFFFVGLGYLLLTLTQASFAKKTTILLATLIISFISTLAWPTILILIALGVIINKLKNWGQLKWRAWGSA